MSLDRNKTPLTHAITKRVALWMDERGFKPVETEVSLGNRWIADLAGVITPSQTELIELKLIKRAPRSVRGTVHTEADRTDAREAYQAWRTAMAAISPILTCAVEVKVSRSDFTGDWKWQAPAQTDLRYVALPRGLIPEAELPRQWGWGIIEMSEDGSRVLKAHAPALAPMTAEQRLQVVLALAVRQFNTVRYAKVREWQREVTLEQADRRVTGRIQDAIGVVIDVVNGRRSVDDALLARNIRAKVSDWTRQELEKLRPKAEAEVAA